MKDTILYDRLGISPNLSCREIKKLGKKLLLRWHPDKNPNQMEESSRKFIEIKEILDILGDAEKRETYHEMGIEILNTKIPAFLFYFSFPYPTPFEFAQGFRYHFPQFANGFPYHSQNDERVVFELDFESSVLKDRQEFNLNYQRTSPCMACKCCRCNGSGLSDKTANLICFLCGGLGSFKIVSCRACHGQRRVFKKQETLSITFEKSILLKVIKQRSTITLKNNDHDLIIIPHLKIKTI
jgi:DnaJ-class molecular chaperone